MHAEGPASEDDTPGPSPALVPDPVAEAAALEVRAESAAAAGTPAVAAARALAGVERDVILLRRDLMARGEEGRGEGHPYLARVAAWRDAADAAGAAGGADRADGLLHDLLADEFRAWREGAGPALEGGDADLLFEALGRASLLAREALSLEREDRRPPPSLADGRESVRGRFVAALEAQAPSPALRERWTRDLLDRAEVALTGLDDVSPARAALHLGLVRDDLAWHLHHVETAPGARRRRLSRKLRRLKHEWQERDLQARVEARFGLRASARFERWVLGLILLVLGLLLTEAVLDLPTPLLIAFTVLDTLACGVFLLDFFWRLALVQGKGSWLLRHVWIDFLPSLPFGLLLLGWGHGDPARVGRLARLLRLPQAARYVRVLLPVIRLVRALGFFVRGMDRLARRYGHLLNRDVILHPTRAERAAARAAPGDPGRRLRHVEAAVEDRFRDLLAGASAEERDAVVAARVDGLAAARREGLTRAPLLRAGLPRGREIPADLLLDRLSSSTGRDVEQDLGADLVARLARAIRWIARPPLRWLPGLGGAAPRLAPRQADAEVVAAGARSLAARLRRARDRWLWFADLYGTVTPAEFVDRVGTAMVKGSFGPAYRLTVFGLFFLLAQLILELSRSDFIQWLLDILNRVVGTTLIVLGSVCFVILGIGWWLKRVANEATSFYEQVAAARFLPLMESIKGRFLARDAGLFDRRVFAPEARLGAEEGPGASALRQERFVGEVRSWLLEAHARGDAPGTLDPVERSVLLYRDALNGGLLTASDVRTTNQLLGNPALADLWQRCRRVTRAERRALRRIDLERQRTFLRGPYLWFSFVTTALEHAVARLIVEYNRAALPLGDLERAAPAEREATAAWLERRGAPSDGGRGRGFATTEFTALHFLDDDPRRDREVRQRFGEAVARRLAEDRRLLFRRVFGTYPLHERPRDQRVLNLHGLYETWLAGGRVFVLPLRLIGRSARFVGRFVVWTARAVREIRRPSLRADVTGAAVADFAAALRKIDRMRGPVVRASIWLRARTDPEYLGLPLPGDDPGSLPGSGLDSDLRFLAADPDLALRLEVERRRARADLHRLAALLAGGLRERLEARTGLRLAGTREERRAIAVAYRGDIDGVRSLLAAEAVLSEAREAALREEPLPRRWLPAPALHREFLRWWRSVGGGGRAHRRATWRRIRHDLDGAGQALRALSAHGAERAREMGERALAEILRHPQRLSEQVVTLRAVQTLAMVDLRNYREHVWRLGRYADDGDDAGGALDLEHA